MGLAFRGLRLVKGAAVWVYETIANNAGECLLT